MHETDSSNFFLFGTFNMATATTVDRLNSAIFSFDTSTLGEEDITGFSYSTNGTGVDDFLSVDAIILISVGSRAGRNDFASFAITNLLGVAINNMSAHIGRIVLPAALDIFCVTVGYYNDIFSIEKLSLFNSTGLRLVGTNERLVVSAVAVPAAAGLFGSALLGFFGLSRRKNQA